jgi:hypothetical protein
VIMDNQEPDLFSTLEEIKQNTAAVKEKVVDEPAEKAAAKAEKRREQLKEAQSKFKKVGYSAKKDDYDVIVKRAGGNISQYVKRLVEADLAKSPDDQASESLIGALNDSNNARHDQILELEDRNRTLVIEKTKLAQELNEIKAKPIYGLLHRFGLL